MPARLPRSPRAWIQEARIFQVQPLLYADHDGRGSGTLCGITQHLSQIHDDGYNCVWVTPFYASPLLDGGFDITDHRLVHPLFGTNEDLEELCHEADTLGIAICAELVMGHTSNQHPWFLASSDAANPEFARYRDYYHWTNNPEKWAAAPLMFPDQESANTALSAPACRPVCRRCSWRKDRAEDSPPVSWRTFHRGTTTCSSVFSRP